MMRKKYNHASISFTEDFKDVYTMGRYRHKTPILAGPIKEYPDRLSLRREKTVPCVIYKVPVDIDKYSQGIELIYNIMKEREDYLYNLYSVLTYPVLKGFNTPKAFSCSEFVAYILRAMEVDLSDIKTCSYTPWYLHEDLKQYMYYEGNILPLMKNSNHDEVDYFSDVKFFPLVGKNITVLSKLLYRLCFRKKQKGQ
ncbi:MAG: hypothetical protein IJZ94_05975 [Clostridia bacterium]|nr:hypothetical protein [Clostridia bacterium]